ncbi:MAG: hypothetical protein IMZ65_00470 [Planctomycetes bacterium]|nr:hypothetical protein [Planctomycetota bacterium]
MKSLVALAAICLLLVGCQAQNAPLSIRIEKVNAHPSLPDHDRVLVALVGNQPIDRMQIYPDAGAGVYLHYVAQDDGIIAVDANGTWYKITRQGISKLGWRWQEPPPQGAVHRISADDRHEYVTTPVGNVALSDVYQHKDPD